MSLFSHLLVLLKSSKAGGFMRPMQDRPIAQNDESQVCWLTSLNCGGVMGGWVLGVGSSGNFFACKMWGENALELTRSTSPHTVTALLEHPMAIYSRSLLLLSSPLSSISSCALLLLLPLRLLLSAHRARVLKSSL